MATADLIEVNDLSAGYQDSQVLSNVTFKVPRASTTVIMGRSGCGKSTLMKTMIGLLKPLAGEIVYRGAKLSAFSEKELRAFYRSLGVLFQGSALLNSLSVADNVSLPLRLHCPKMPRQMLEEMVAMRLAQVGLQGVETVFPGALSGGMRKRVGLARSLIMDPEIIFCDEPSAGLDPITAVGIDDLILSLRDQLGVTFVVVTHELASIHRISDRVVFLHQGGLLFEGERAAMTASGHSELIRFMARKGDNDHS